MILDIILFIILGLLFVIEATTSLSRKAGYFINNPSTGFVFQSSLGLISRMLVFLFMPLLGYLSDKNMLPSKGLIIILYLIIPFLLFLLFLFKTNVEKFYIILLYRMDTHGSFFKRLNKKINLNLKKTKLLKINKKLKRLYFIYLLAYIPYYLAWPIIIILLSQYHDNRGMILGMSSVFNGINTIIITLFIDPKLTQLGKYNRVIQYVYSDLIFLRLIASILAYIVLLFIVGLV